MLTESQFQKLFLGFVHVIRICKASDGVYFKFWGTHVHVVRMLFEDTLVEKHNLKWSSLIYDGTGKNLGLSTQDGSIG